MIVVLLAFTPTDAVPMMVPLLLRPPVNVVLATEIPELPAITPLLEMLVVLESLTKTPALDRPEIEPAFEMLPTTEALATDTPVLPEIVAPVALTIEPLMVLKETKTPAAEP